jgi:hypothetical protein
MTLKYALSNIKLLCTKDESVAFFVRNFQPLEFCIISLRFVYSIKGGKHLRSIQNVNGYSRLYFKACSFLYKEKKHILQKRK